MRRTPLGILSALLLTGCPMTEEPVVQSYLPTCTFNPTASTAGQGISIAIVNPQLSDAAKSAITMGYARMGQPVPVTGGEDPAYRALRDAVGRSMLSYFTSSGFTVSGPFASVDMMTFPEKKQADLMLTVDFGVLTDQPTPHVIHNSDGTVALVVSQGTCTTAGSIVFVLWEPLSMQRMWTKAVDVTPSTFDCTLSLHNPENYNTTLYNGFNKSYEEIFRSTLTAAMRYFDPQEVALIKAQAQELREKKVY